MVRKVCAAGLLVLLVGVVALSSTGFYLALRMFSTADGVVYLLDNETGASQTTLVLIVSGGVTVTPSDVTVFGGGEVASITTTAGGVVVYIEVEVAAGGTVQIQFPGDNAAGSIRLARFL